MASALQIGVLHPGEMGASVAACLKEAGARVWFASEGRSDATRERARSAQLEDAGSLRALCGKSDVLFSVCPPASAATLAGEVAKTGFAGVYVDANAVNPESARRIGELVASSGARFVDGGLIGPPAHREGTTRLALAG